MAYFSCPNSTSKTEIIDNVNGNWIENTEPFSYVESIEMLPPNISIVVLTTSKPTPLPETSETSFDVEKPLSIISSYTCWSDNKAASSSEITPLDIALAKTLSLSIPAPSSLISINTWLPLWNALN